MLEILSAFFAREGFAYAVIGAFGLHAYGRTRATHDLDCVTESEAQPRLIEFLEGLGYETLHLSEGYSNHLHPDSSMGRVDFIYVSGETKRRLFEAAGARLRIGETSVPVPRAEHLVAMKIQAMKNDPERTFQEMADIQFLIQLPGIDQDEVRKYFERSGLLDRYDELKRII